MLGEFSTTTRGILNYRHHNAQAQAPVLTLRSHEVLEHAAFRNYWGLTDPAISHQELEQDEQRMLQTRDRQALTVARPEL